jgi:bis(5'-nucleosidyl)-tetraphosphatase
MKRKMLSAGTVILHRGPDDCRYLLLRSYRYWDFPKGIVEAGEPPFSAACSERMAGKPFCAFANPLPFYLLT